GRLLGEAAVHVAHRRAVDLDGDAVLRLERLHPGPHGLFTGHAVERQLAFLLGVRDQLVEVRVRERAFPFRRLRGVRTTPPSRCTPWWPKPMPKRIETPFC